MPPLGNSVFRSSLPEAPRHTLLQACNPRARHSALLQKAFEQRAGSSFLPSLQFRPLRLAFFTRASSAWWPIYFIRNGQQRHVSPSIFQYVSAPCRQSRCCCDCIRICWKGLRCLLLSDVISYLCRYEYYKHTL